MGKKTCVTTMLIPNATVRAAKTMFMTASAKKL
jgi:hypothetical protein